MRRIKYRTRTRPRSRKMTDIRTAAGGTIEPLNAEPKAQPFILTF